MASIPSQVYDILPKQKHIYAESMFVFGAFDIFFIEDSQRFIKMAVYNLSIFGMEGYTVQADSKCLPGECFPVT